MSLQIAAKHLASHGRGPDTTLVHMTPGEVASLQSLAQQHGGSLTTNPHTGLPEAGFLSALLPMAAGAGLAAMGMPAGYAALAVGATSAATSGGDLKKGLMAGMSAYGGAGMAESFMGAGLGTMGGAMAAPAAEAAPAVAAAPAVSAAPAVAEIAPSAGSIAGSSMQEAVNQSGMYAPALTSAAPAEVAKQAAAMTPAAQAAQQSAALNDLTMGQRWDALKAGATGANAMKYIKANPFTSLGVAASFMAPDENKAPQTTTDTDRGPRAGLQYHPGWSTPLPKPNMYGVEQTYNRPYYAAEGGITHMAEGGSTGYKDYDGVEMSPAMRELLAQQDRSLREIQRLKAQQAGTPPAQLDQKQLFADYLQRVAGGAGAGSGSAGGDKYDWWKPYGDEGKTIPAETPEEYAERVRLNARGGGGSGRTVVDEGGTWTEPTSQQAYNWSQAGKQLGVISPLVGGLVGAYGNYLARNVDPNYGHEGRHSLATPVGAEDIDTNAAWAKMDADTAAEKEAQAQQRAAEEKQRQRDILQREFQKAMNLINVDPNVLKGDTGIALADKVATLKNQIDKLDSPFGDRFVPATHLGVYGTEDLARALENLEPGDRFAPVDFSNQDLSPEQYQAEVERTNAALTPAAEGTPYGLNYQKPNVATNPFVSSVSPDGLTTTGMTYAMPVNAEERAQDLSDYGAYTSKFNLGTLAPDALRYSGTGVPDTLKTPEVQGVNEIKAVPEINPVDPYAVDSDYVGQYSPATDVAALGYGNVAALTPGTATPNIGGRSNSMVSFGGLGNVWRSADGTPIRDGQGVSWGTGESVGQESSNDKVERIVREAQEANPGGGGNGSDNNGAGVHEGGYSNSLTRSNDQGDGGGANGGLSTPYGFQHMAYGGLSAMPNPYNLGSYSDGGRLLKGPGDGVSDSIPATIGKGRPARLADGEFVVPARIVSEIGNGSTEAGARKLYAMMDRIQAGRKKSIGKDKVAVNSRADKHLPA
jgi:hypothetical protein